VKYFSQENNVGKVVGAPSSEGFLNDCASLSLDIIRRLRLTQNTVLRVSTWR